MMAIGAGDHAAGDRFAGGGSDERWRTSKESLTTSDMLPFKQNGSSSEVFHYVVGSSRA